jgi:two-component system sensor histidine kinase/response regulator
MGGRIWVDSQPGAGLGVSFHMRAWAVQAQVQPRRMFKADDCGHAVLVVDDNASRARSWPPWRKAFGLQVDVAQTGARPWPDAGAGRAAEAVPYDLVLMDWKMPVMDGVETMRQLQRRPGQSAGGHHGHRLWP